MEEKIPDFVVNSKKYELVSPEYFSEDADLIEESKNDREKFWERVGNNIYWYRKFDRVLEGDFPDFKFYTGGISNVYKNLVGIHVESGSGNRAALIFESETGNRSFYTYSMLARNVNKLARALKNLGMKKGSRIAIFMPNIPETLISILACYKGGYIFNTIFSGFSSKALKDRIDDFEPDIIITADGTYRRSAVVNLKEKVDQMLYSRPHKTIVVRNIGIDIEIHRDDLSFEDLIENSDELIEDEKLEANETGLVFYTSGTTGKPKGIVHSGIAFLVNDKFYAKHQLALKAGDVLWCTADIGWLTMHIWGIIGALSNGITTIFYEGALDYPSIENFYRVIERYQVTKLFVAPTVIRMLMRSENKDSKRDLVKSVRLIGLVGEPLNPEAWHWMRNNFPKVYINNTWGQTETAGTPLSGIAFHTSMKPGSSGIEFYGVKCEIVDENGNSVGINRPGNLVIKHPIPMMVRDIWHDHDRYLREYFGPVKGYYFTYDVAVMDGDGHFWVLGRNDDVINVAGHRLSTMEMESAVMGDRRVAECAAIGVPDTVKGIVPVIFYSLRFGYAYDESIDEDIRNTIVKDIGKIANPDAVIAVKEMPKTPSGKILRRFLRDIFVYGNTRGDATGLENPASIESVRSAIEESREK